MIDRRKMVTTWTSQDDLPWLLMQKERIEKEKHCEILKSKGKIALFFKNGYYKSINNHGKKQWIATGECNAKTKK